jgi:hypothetical protein
VINFRYHIVSLMAVFLALSVGIVLGVSLRGPVDQGLVSQADTDRKQVTELRAELDRRSALDDYRDAWAQRSGTALTEGLLAGRSVAVIAMPDAPGSTVNAISTATTAAGGTVTHTVKINQDVFDSTKAEVVSKALARYSGTLGFTSAMTNGTRFGRALGRAVLGREALDADGTAADIIDSLTAAGLVSVAGKSTEQAELAVVVTAEATDPRPAPQVLEDHVQMDVALKQFAMGVVVAGPNSTDIDGTDVLTARSDSAAVDTLSTVDVADLASGVTTVMLAGKEQLLGRSGQYGALTKADAPMPQLPVR